MVLSEQQDSELEIASLIDGLVHRARQALDAFMQLNQAEIDNVVKQMSLAGLNRHMELAKHAVEETHRGVYEDKCIKNIFATEYIYHNIKYDKTVGLISENRYERVDEIAEPVGVVAGVTPVTNPTSTTLFKSLISVKTRNPIIFAFHPSAQQCSREAAKTMLEAAVAAGAPEHCIQWIETPSVTATQTLMNHPGVALILATGGTGMVQSAYSSGKPALGVGPGNVPCYIEKTADVKRAVTDLILSKTFDNGMICASEQAVIVDREIAAVVKAFMIDNGCYFLSKSEIEQVSNVVIQPQSGAVNGQIVGQPAATIAKQAGLDVPASTKILIAALDGVGPEFPLSREKLSPVLAFYVVNGWDEGIRRAEEMVAFGGMGHSAVIHSNDPEVIDSFGRRIRTGRLIVNQPSSQGAIGDIYNAYMPSLTLGCGSFGHNSTTSNVSAINLLNIKRLSHRTVNMQWFKVPPKIYFEKGATKYLEKMPDIKRVFVVTDADMVRLGYLDRVMYYLRKRPDMVSVDVFSETEPNPSLETVHRGIDRMNKFEPDTIIALGGGSPMDAAKSMWLLYEHPDVDFSGMKLKFLDIRKRVYKFPHLGDKVKFVAIPTTSGTGSEVTSFSVISDENHMKYPVADYELTPDVAIVDVDYVMTMPKAITADTGMDVLTHAIEAYVSNMANDFTDGLCIKAIQLVFEYLPLAYRNGSDVQAREKMHNASTIAGMAFANAFLGINHSLAHKLGAQWDIPHGRANSILLPHVIRYNAQKPTKFSGFPKYGTFVADERYAQISRALGLPAITVAEGVESLIDAVTVLAKVVEQPATIAKCGVDAADFDAQVEYVAERAFEDQCTPANPKLPLVSELAEILRTAYTGHPVPAHS